MRALRAFALALALSSPAAAASVDEGLALLRRGEAAQAYEVLRKSALAGDARAARALGFMLERDLALPGDRVLVAKPEQAAGWYLKAFESGDKESADALGLLFYQGRGVSRDVAESLRWFRHNNGDVDRLAQSFTDLADADRAEVVAWWLSLRMSVRREIRYPRIAQLSNVSGTVEVVFDAGKGTAEIGGRGASGLLREAALAVGQSVLRELPPPPAAVRGKVRSSLTIEFRLV